MIELRTIVVVRHPELVEPSGNQQNWGVIERFNDTHFVVRVEEGLREYWVFPLELIPWDTTWENGEQLEIKCVVSGVMSWGVMGPNAREIVDRMMHGFIPGGVDG